MVPPPWILAAVACGRFEGFWEFGLHPWDTAAGVFLVREAGGTVTTFSGQPTGRVTRRRWHRTGKFKRRCEVAAGVGSALRQRAFV